MPRIQYLTDGRTIEVGSGTTLLRASLDHAIARTLGGTGGRRINRNAAPQAPGFAARKGRK